MQHFHRTEPDYRLLHETGRLSSTAIYVVGVYCGLEKLAEGKIVFRCWFLAHGPSLLMAQERAAVEALYKLFLVDTPEAPRHSDLLLTLPSINTVDALKSALGKEKK